MEPAVWILGTTTVAFGSFILRGFVDRQSVAKRIDKKVNDERCRERREACLATLNEKLDTHTQALKRIEDKIEENGKR